MSQDAIGKGPVLFFTSDGLLIQIPLEKIHFNDGAVSTDLAGATQTMQDWLAYLAKRGELEPAKGDPPAAALIAKAAVDGVEGNNVELEIKPSVGATNRVDVRVKKVDRYDGLTLATLNERLGTAAAPAPTNSGLLRVHTNEAGAPDPVVRNPVPADSGTWTIAASTGTAAKVVKLEPKRTGTGFNAAHFTVAISDVTPGTGGVATRFTLTVTWAPPAALNVEAAQIPAALAGFQYLVTFEAPTTGYKLPAPATTTLVGGREAVAPVPASATALATP